MSFTAKQPWPGLKPGDLNGLENQIKEKFNWDHSPHPFQLEAIKAQLLRKDVLIHAGTGMGKTAVAAGPFIDTRSAGMVSFMVSPLIALQHEQVTTFREEFKLRVVAVNSTGPNRCTGDIMSKICKGEWQIVVISPEMLLSKRFIANVIRNRDLASRIMSVVVDEAHVISHWGSGFRKMYGRLGILRALLPKGTSFVAMSATLPPRVRKDILAKLHYNEFVDLNLGNDRANVSVVVRAIHNPMNTYSDLAFVVPANANLPADIKKTFIYADKIEDGIAIQDYLKNRLPERIWKTGIVRPYSAAYTVEHRARVMALFRAGVVRVLVCTDAAGMGCNIPDIEVVVQWKMPPTVSSFVQRAGRAARQHERTGLAVLLVEKAVYEADLFHLAPKRSAANANMHKKSIRQSATYLKAGKQYAITHGARRGTFDGAHDNNALATEPVPLDRDSIDEGLYTLAQSVTCRRAIIQVIYGNEAPAPPTVPCCDICHPDLLKQVRPAPARATVAKKTPLRLGIPEESVVSKLQEWRREIWERDHGYASMFAPSGILSDQALEALAAVGPIQHLNELERVLGEHWPWFGRYGDELLSKLLTLDMPPMRPKPAQPRSHAKRAVNDDERQSGAKRRPFVDRIPAPVNSTPAATSAAWSSIPHVPPQLPYQHNFRQAFTVSAAPWYHPTTSDPPGQQPLYPPGHPLPTTQQWSPPSAGAPSHTSDVSSLQFRHYDPHKAGHARRNERS